MHKKFDHQAIEKKWQATWATEGLYDAGQREESKNKEYVLVELPYPSGNLHIGHWYAFAVPDIYVRAHRMQGKQVIYPMGFDAFGLPAENAAIKRNIDPREWTESNIEYMKGQLASMGASFSWDKTASTIDPTYYKWTQWMFTKFFENGIAYRGKGTVNWCPGCNTVIANEQIIDSDKCERSGDTIEKREMPQWMLKITDYADRLIDDLDGLNWPEPIKDAQRNWIGRSQGAEIDFALSTGDTVTVFTTRPDTLYGATYMVLAPEHTLVQTHKTHITNWDDVAAYIEATKRKAEQDRLDATKEKTGVKLEGITATNPANGEEIPVYIADYVLASYGTGAIMAVPAHDERDYAFARKFNLSIKAVVAEQPVTHAGAILQNGDSGTYLFQKRTMDAPTNPGQQGMFGGGIESGERWSQGLRRELEEELELEITVDDFGDTYAFLSKTGKHCISATFITVQNKDNLILHEGEAIVEMSLEELIKRDDVSPKLLELVTKILHNEAYYTGSGYVFNSGEFDGLHSDAAKQAITKKVGGRLTNTYRLRDWSVGRQRYWGVPVPIVYDPDGKPHPVPEEHLPWTLPDDVDFRPTGEAPLAKSAELKKRTEEIFGVGWTPEVETLDTFVDSSWYFMRYIDNQCDDAPASLAAQETWMPVDIYFGGAEHTTMHLLYSRFWQKALYDLKLAVHPEPYVRRLNRGLILGPDGNKMSKSKGNVIDPDEQVKNVGADAVKMYLAFMGPYGEVVNYPWDLGGIAGQKRFLERVNGLHEHITDAEPEATLRQLHKTIRKVTEDIEVFKFNTAISALMVFINQAEKAGLSQNTYEIFLRLLAPFAPHLTEELWAAAGHDRSIHLEAWPAADESLLADDTVTIGVQINGKHRGEITIAPDAQEATAMDAVLNNTQLAAKLDGQSPKKVIYVPGRILNLIV